MKEVVAPNRRQKTKERYEAMIRHQIKPAIGGLDIAKLGPSDIHALESQLSNQLTPK
jgi:hypothetical protein